MSFQEELAQSERIERESGRAERRAKKKSAKVRAKKAATRRSVGNAYSDATLADLERSGLNEADADSMQIREVDAEWCHEHLDVPRAGYLIPYFDISGKALDFFRVRFTEFTPPEHVAGKDYYLDERRYTQPTGTGTHAYLSRRIDWRKVLADKSTPLYITEGEKKSEALCKSGFIAIGNGGIWNFRDDGALLEELRALAEGGRKITLVYDSDRSREKKKAIRQAEAILATQLRAAGAKTFLARLPDDGEAKVGADDFLVAHGKAKLKAILEAATEFDARAIISALRESKKSNHERHRLIAATIVSDMGMLGRFIRTDTDLYFFDHVGKVLIRIDEKSRELRAFMDDRYALSAADPEWPFTFEKLADSAYTNGERATVHKLAFFDSKSHTWYRSKSASQLFKATAAGWSVVDNGTDGVLISTRGAMEDITVPDRAVSRAAFDAVIGVPNFVGGSALTAKQARLVWSIFVVAFNFPTILPTRPIALKVGEKGSGKTSGGRAVLRTEYGARGEVTLVNPKKPDALEAVIVNNAIAVLDNCDGRHVELQNMLAIVGTGGMIKARTLYSTMGVSEFRADCFLTVTSRDPRTLIRDDLIDRLLVFNVARRQGFVAESELMARIDSGRPAYWRWLLDNMPKIIKALGRSQAGATFDHRMADFAKFAVAVGPVLGYSAAEVRAALDAMQAEKMSFAADHSTLVGGLSAYVEHHAKLLAAEETPEAHAAYLAKLLVPRSAGELLAAIHASIPEFAFVNPMSFAKTLAAEEPAVAERLSLKKTLNKRTKNNSYVIEPLGGFAGWKV